MLCGAGSQVTWPKMVCSVKNPDWCFPLSHKTVTGAIPIPSPSPPLGAGTGFPQHWGEAEGPRGHPQARLWCQRQARGQGSAPGEQDTTQSTLPGSGEEFLARQTQVCKWCAVNTPDKGVNCLPLGSLSSPLCKSKG